MTRDVLNSTWPQAAALWPLLPSQPQTLLLQACLGSTEVIGQHWRKWCQEVRDPRRAILRNKWGMKSILPLLHDSLRRGGVILEKNMQTVLRTAFFHERLRLATIHRLCRGLLRALSANNIEAILTGELGLAETAYASPALRHCGHIHLLISAKQIDRAVNSICAEHWGLLERRGQGDDAYARLAEESGLELQITSRVRYVPHSGDTLADLGARSEKRIINDTAMCLPCRADLLLMAMDYALIHGSWQQIEWVCDSHMLVKHFDDEDWASLLEIVVRNHLTWPTLAVLNYLKESFDCHIPAAVMDGLGRASAENQKVCQDVAKFCARSAVRSDLAEAWRHAPGIQQRIWVLVEAVRMLKKYRGKFLQRKKHHTVELLTCTKKVPNL